MNAVRCNLAWQHSTMSTMSTTVQRFENLHPEQQTSWILMWWNTFNCQKTVNRKRSRKSKCKFLILNNATFLAKHVLICLNLNFHPQPDDRVAAAQKKHNAKANGISYLNASLFKWKPHKNRTCRCRRLLKPQPARLFQFWLLSSFWWILRETFQNSICQQLLPPTDPKIIIPL